MSGSTFDWFTGNNSSLQDNPIYMQKFAAYQKANPNSLATFDDWAASEGLMQNQGMGLASGLQAVTGVGSLLAGYSQMKDQSKLGWANYDLNKQSLQSNLDQISGTKDNLLASRSASAAKLNGSADKLKTTLI